MRSNRLNTILFVLLAIVALGLFAMPRVNHAVLAEQYKTLSRRLGTMSDRVQALGLLFGDEGDRRAGVAATLDTIPSTVKQLREGWAASREETAALAAVVQEHDERLQALEAEAVPMSLSDLLGAESPLATEETIIPRSTDSIDLSPDLQSKAELLSARETAEWDFDKFLQTAMERSFLPFVATEEIPSELYDRIERAFLLYKTSVGLINFEERLHIADLVARAEGAGEFHEVPIEPDDGTDVPPVHRGALHVKVLEEFGVRRYFHFPLETHPQIGDFETLRENILKHFTRDLVGLVDAAGDAGRMGQR